MKACLLLVVVVVVVVACFFCDVCDLLSSVGSNRLGLSKLPGTSLCLGGQYLLTGKTHVTSVVKVLMW